MLVLECLGMLEGSVCVVRGVFFGQTWRLHHCLQILLLELLNAFRFGHVLLLQGAHLVHVLIVEEFQV